MKKYLKTGVGPVLNQRIEVTAMRRSGEEFPIELSIIPILRGKKHSFTAFIRDITLAKRTKDEMEKSLIKERELNELKSRFVSMTSHEFRTPLTTIKQNVDLIGYQLEASLPNAKENFNRYFQRIDSEIGRVTNLMNDILLLGKIEAGKVEISKRNEDLVQLANQCIQKICQGRLDQRGIKLETKGIERPVQIDLQLMEHVLTNIMSNSLKYSPDEKDPELTISFRSLSEVIISCKDLGIGIPKKDQKGLFSSFYRTTNVKNIQGTGLGLSIVKEFVVMHGGTIEVVSDTNQGATFIISIPTT
jgi:signal transduction histidine kinase